MKKGIITVVGQDQVGIIAEVCGFLAKNEINILDISQTIIEGYFNMMMIVDISNLTNDFGAVSKDIESLGTNIGVNIKLQHEDIFNKMHRI
ncbi:MAG: ACT domain-containing protein [Coprobacillaceae bacterium]